VPAIQRQFHYRFLADGGADFRSGGVDQLHVGRHCDDLRLRADWRERFKVAAWSTVSVMPDWTSLRNPAFSAVTL